MSAVRRIQNIVKLTRLSFNPHCRTTATVRYVEIVYRRDIGHALPETDKEVGIVRLVVVMRSVPFECDAARRGSPVDLVEDALRCAETDEQIVPEWEDTRRVDGVLW